MEELGRNSWRNSLNSEELSYDNFKTIPVKKSESIQAGISEKNPKS